MKNGNYAFSDHFKYKYDSMGNITEIRENGELYAKYTYDTIGRLVREDNKKLGKTTAFTYDTNGNILCRKEYAFTLTDKLDELDYTDFVYTYDGDKLLSYNGEACEYDAIGNPTTYRGLKASWANGRQLSSYNNTPFTYDNLGRRISKNSVTFVYDANGNLIHQRNGISFIYDASGVCGLTYSGATYFYRKDILGNIVALLGATGEIVAKYTYDAWGNHTITETNGNVITDENHIANLNPFRYRGYYYDVETGLYFLKTRYYDPETGRFITIDDISYLDPESINGLNLYAYCRNNPVMCVDPNGNSPEWWQWLLVGVGAVLVVTAITILTCGIGTSVMVGTLAGAMLHGAAIGTLIGAGTGTIAGGIIGGIISDWSAEGIIDGVMIGFGGGAIVGAIIGASVGGIHYSWQQSVLRRAGSFSSYADEATELHHIVEQCQINKSGFSSKLIRNSNNEVRIAKSLHSKVSRYYSSLYKKTGMRFRNYLAANHYSLGRQYNIGIKVLNMMLKGMI